MAKSRLRWLKLSRVVPLVTVLAAAASLIATQAGVLGLTAADQITIGLVGLLAIDALTERLSVLERIERQLTELHGPSALKTRALMPSVAEQARDAREVCLMAVHGSSAIAPSLGLFRDKLEQGCRIRILLTDPSAPWLDSYASSKTLARELPREAIRFSLSYLQELSVYMTRNLLQVRLTVELMPYTMLATNLHDAGGAMLVEFQTSGQRRKFGLT
jgi:hypothetical protein